MELDTHILNLELNIVYVYAQIPETLKLHYLHEDIYIFIIRWVITYNFVQFQMLYDPLKCICLYSYVCVHVCFSREGGRDQNSTKWNSDWINQIMQIIW